MTMTVCVVLTAGMFMTCLQLLVDSLDASLEVAAVPLFQTVSASRFFEGFFHLADFLLDLPGYLFADIVAFQVGIIRQLAHLFLNLASHFVNLACDLILNAWLHPGVSSYAIRVPVFLAPFSPLTSERVLRTSCAPQRALVPSPI